MKSGFGHKIWEPSNERIAHSNMTLFRKFLNKKNSLNLQKWDDLYTWSTDNPGEFWKIIGDYTGIIWNKQAKNYFTPPPKGLMRGAKWFEKAKLNFAENILRKVNPQKDAIVSYHEGSFIKKLTGQQLINRVAQLAQQLRKLGLKKGQHVFGVLNNDSYAIEIMLAVTSIGAVFSSCSPDFGYQGIYERARLINPTILFYSANHTYKGKESKTQSNISELKQALLASVIYIEINEKKKAKDTPCDKKIYDYKRLLDQVDEESNEHSIDSLIKFEPTNFDDPLYIMFSSGTTGTPKCIVHGVGGTLLQHKKELMLHCDLKASEKIMFYTTCSWMMWNWVVSSLSVGACLVLYDGSPSHPNPSSFWDVCEKEKVSIAGTSPSYIAYSEEKNLKPKEKYAFTQLKCLLSTGSPLLPKNFFWVYKSIKTDLHLASISGGTDILSCFVLGNPNLPVHTGEIQCFGLGMRIKALERPNSLNQKQKLELACTQAFVSMPLYFLNDPEGLKYQESYFHTCFEKEEVWWHGDSIEITQNQGIIIHGRSDATLNPNGVRIGTSEIYNAIASLCYISDSIVVSKKNHQNEEVILFVVLKNNQKLNESLKNEIKKTIQESLTKRHVPNKILQVKDIPYTHSGKKVELLIKKIIHGETVSNQSSLKNPECLREFFALQNFIYKETKSKNLHKAKLART